MTCRFRVHPAVLDTDLGEAMNYYGDVAVGLAGRLATDFLERLTSIREQPLAGRQIFDEFRRRVLRDFPYLVIYYVDSEEILVLGLIHARRRPSAIHALVTRRGLSAP